MNLGFSRALGLASKDCLVQDCLGVRSQEGGVVTSMEKGLVKRPGSVLSWWSKVLITKAFFLTYYPLNVPDWQRDVISKFSPMREGRLIKSK